MTPRSVTERAPNVGNYRICQLGNTSRWRVEKFCGASWPWSLFVRPQWRLVYRPSLFLDSVPAEYDSRDEAQLASDKFRQWDHEQALRARSAWEPR